MSFSWFCLKKKKSVFFRFTATLWGTSRSAHRSFPCRSGRPVHPVIHHAPWPSEARPVGKTGVPRRHRHPTCSWPKKPPRPRCALTVTWSQLSVMELPFLQSLSFLLVELKLGLTIAYDRSDHRSNIKRSLHKNWTLSNCSQHKRVFHKRLDDDLWWHFSSMSCLQLEQRSRRHLMVVMSLLAQKVLSYLRGAVLWSFFSPTALETGDMLCLCVFFSFRISYKVISTQAWDGLYLLTFSSLMNFPFISHLLGYLRITTAG